MTEELMKPNEVATWLKKSRSWVYAAVARGEIPHKRIGRDLRFSQTELNRWLESCSVSTTPASLKGEE